MAKRDEGALKTVGWGPFALRGERKRLREAEDRRLAEVAAMVTAAAAEGPDEDRGTEPAARPQPADVIASFAGMGGEVSSAAFQLKSWPGLVLGATGSGKSALIAALAEGKADLFKDTFVPM